MKTRWIVIAVAIVYSGYVLLSHETEDSWTFSTDNITKNIQLGLDLKGGIFMQLEVDVEDAVDHYVEEQAGTIKASLEAENMTVGSSDPQIKERRVVLANLGSTINQEVVPEVKRLYRDRWDIRGDANQLTLTLREGAIDDVKKDAVTQTVYKIQNRIDQLGVSEPNINQVVGTNRIVVELAGTDDQARVQKLVKEPGQLEWRMVAKGALNFAQRAEELQPYLKPGYKILPMKEGEGFYLLEPVMMTASNVSRVMASRDETGFPAIGINLDRAGGQIMDSVTGQPDAVGRQLAVILDGKVLTAPVIRQRLSNSFVISGSFSAGEVDDKILQIKSGSLPASVRILEERVIGPTLGRDAIRQGTTAAVIGFGAVMVFIVIYYRIAGLFAICALFINLLLMLGMLAGIDAILTLPGIAGFILTIGMAVDANVLIFEKIREELRQGTAVKNAVDIGYQSAFVTILDANITTFIAAFCLLLLGEGPIKGFAIMLMIGIVCSIFTAVFCSRTFFMTYLRSSTTHRTLSIWPLWRGAAATSPQ
ncbi:protein translocase subunit SecD [Acanthopleuribacter pedis]|uniref:Protein translocase subunit SecD n=1 Tax=Acanthopleuribacter pedis TaxID=442870 RepID=A0A8J7U2X5_9BACT|nr:protein translocase subunit SecD [Acanthopleuribacter pedis]MBO1319037.1 protein translocase subunit SecD [Acanthopleuribacter pedis]